MPPCLCGASDCPACAPFGPDDTCDECGADGALRYDRYGRPVCPACLHQRDNATTAADEPQQEN